MEECHVLEWHQFFNSRIRDLFATFEFNTAEGQCFLEASYFLQI